MTQRSNQWSPVRNRREALGWLSDRYFLVGFGPCIFFFMAQKPVEGQGLLIIEAVRSHLVKTHHTRRNASGRVIGPSPRSLPDKRQTSMPHSGFKSTVSAREGPQIHDLDCAANGTGCSLQLITSFLSVESVC